MKREIIFMWHVYIRRSTLGEGCPREDATQKGASGTGRRKEERQGTKNGSPNEELLQAWPSLGSPGKPKGPGHARPKAAGVRTRHCACLKQGLDSAFQHAKISHLRSQMLTKLENCKPVHILCTGENGELWVWNDQFLCFQRGTTVGCMFTGNQHVSNTPGEMSPSVKFTTMNNSNDCIFFITRLRFKLDPSRYGVSTTHQQGSDEQRWSFSSLQALSGMTQGLLCAEIDMQDTTNPKWLLQCWPTCTKKEREKKKTRKDKERKVLNSPHNLIMTFAKNSTLT